MKKVNLITLVLSLGSMVACQSKEDIYVGPTDDDKVTDLIVPEGFDWEMSQDVGLSVESSVESVVDVFNAEDCKYGNLIATLHVPTEEVILSVPIGTKQLYVRYTSKEGNKKVLPVNLINSRAGNDSKGHAKLPEDAGALKNDRGEVAFYYPSNDWGTVLFEDNWPAKGDYDMNDFVAWYKIQQYTEDNKKTGTILISVTMTAMGGSFPYQLCIRMDGIKYKDISDIEEYYGNKYKASLSETGNGDALLTYNWDNLKGSKGGNYYNTEDEYSPVSKEELKENQVTYIISMENEINILSHQDFDFFLKRKDSGHEIHLKGYKPTTNFMPTYNEITNSTPTLTNSQYYTATDGFVWGIKVPKGIGHPKEEIEITEAYPNFAKWLTSGGKEQKNWYNTANQNKCVTVQIE